MTVDVEFSFVGKSVIYYHKLHFSIQLRYLSLLSHEFNQTKKLNKSIFPEDQTESLYHLVQGSTLRTVTYNGMTYENAERLKKLRPLPSYYGVFATTENMEEIFEKEI